MSYRVFDTTGTYTDSTDAVQMTYASGVTLIDSAADSQVFVNSTNANITASASNIVLFNGTFAGNTFALNGQSDVYYGGGAAATVTANGDSNIIVGSGVPGSIYNLAGPHQTYYGGASAGTVNVTGAFATVYGGSDTFSPDMVHLTLASAGNAKITRGIGAMTLSLTDSVADNNAIVMDVGKNIATNLNGLSISNITNLDYFISPGGNAHRTGTTQFTVESGTNEFGFTNSSGTNTVYNIGTGSTTVFGGSGTDVAVGGTTGYTELDTQGGNDYLYGGASGSTNVMAALSGTAGTDRFYAGAGYNDFLDGGGIGNEYMYGGAGTDYFRGGAGTNVLVEGTHSDEFHGTTGTDYVYGTAAASKVYGGSGTDYVYTGAASQYFYSGTGKEYFYQEPNTQTHGRVDVLDNFQIQNGAKGTFVFLPTADASHTTFVASNTGTYIVSPATDGSGGNADIFVPNVAPSTVKAQTYFVI